MGRICKLLDVINDFHFEKGNYLEAERQLVVFAEGYARLTVEEANKLRSKFDAKDRLKWFRVASSVFKHGFLSEDDFKKEKLCRIFFALYSFENLDFGYDALQDVISVSDQLKRNIDITKRSWTNFRCITSNPIAISNMDRNIF